MHILYEWEPFKKFISQVTGVENIYPYIDSLSPININVNEEGQGLNWHYDNCDFSITLMLQPAKKGGTFEYVPWLRSKDNENYDELDKTLKGENKKVQVLNQSAGTLAFFRGRYSVHRVTPTIGKEPRLITVLAYSTEPNKTITKHTRNIFYGRE